MGKIWNCDGNSYIMTEFVMDIDPSKFQWSQIHYDESVTIMKGSFCQKYPRHWWMISWIIVLRLVVLVHLLDFFHCYDAIKCMNKVCLLWRMKLVMSSFSVLVSKSSNLITIMRTRITVSITVKFLVILTEQKMIKYVIF